MVKLPYRSESEVSVPQAVRSHGNGKIPTELLHSCGIRDFKMVEPAARACRAMVAAALADGVRLDASGTYRSYGEQVQMFTERYSETPLAGRPTKTWNDVQYWQKPDVPMAAVPGTSQHGFGLAPDLMQRSASGVLEELDPATLSWLAEHGPSFGFWNSVKSESWHWPYFPGDDIPDAVLQMERSGSIRLQPAVPSATAPATHTASSPEKTGKKEPAAPQHARGSYTIVAADSDGISAVVGRCVGIADAPWALRRAAAEAVAVHNGVTIDAIWGPGDTIRFPPTIEGVRSYTAQAGDGLIAIATGLGLGGSATAQQRVASINAWQGPTPHPGDTWYGGAA